MSGTVNEKELPHITALRRQLMLKKLAKKRLRVTGGRVEIYDATPRAQDLEAIAAEAEERDRLLNPSIGERAGDRGIFIGTWEPKDNTGRSLGKEFNVFAAPQDLHAMTYANAVEFIAGLEGWQGHDGADYMTDYGLKAALKEGSYNGGWVIPPRELLDGRNEKGAAVQADSLFAHKDKGALRGAFMKDIRHGEDYAEWYWSSTEDPASPREMFSARLSDGSEGADNFNTVRLRCRPVRLEPRP